MRRMMLGVVLVVAMASGCAVTKADKDLVATMAAVGQNNLKKWDTLSDAQKKEAQTNMVCAACVLDHNINNRALPPEFAPVTTDGK